MRYRRLRSLLALVLLLSLPLNGVAYASTEQVSPRMRGSVPSGSVSAIVSDDELPGPALQLPTMSGSVGAEDPYDVYSVYLHGGDTLDLGVSTTGDLAVDVWLLGPDADSLDDFPAASAPPGEDFPAYTAETWQAGTYSVVIRHSSGAGDYILTPAWTPTTLADDPDFAANIPGYPILPSPVTGTLSMPDEDDVFAVDLAAGETLVANFVAGPSSATRLLLYPPDATDVFTDEYVANVPVGAQLTYTAPTSGRYYLDMWRGMGEGGPYTLSYYIRNGEWPDAPATSPGFEAPPSPFKGGLDIGVEDTADTYQVWASEGQEISVAVQSPDDLAWASINVSFGGEEEELATSRRTGYGTDVVSVQAPDDAYYDIRISGDQRADYEVSYTVGETDNYLPGPLATSPVLGQLDWASDRKDFVSAEFQGGDIVTVSLESSAGLDADLFVYRPDPYSEDYHYIESTGRGEESVTFQVDSTGVYTFLAKSAAGSGNYRLSWTSAPPSADDDIPGVPLALNVTNIASSTAYSDTTDVYRLSLQAGHKYRFVANGDRFSPGMQLYGDLDASLWSGQRPLVESWADEITNTMGFIAEETGTYYLLMRADLTQDYTVKVIDGGAFAMDDMFTTAPTLTVSPTSGTIDAQSDWVDWYAVSLEEGQDLGVRVKTPAGAEMGLTILSEADMYDGYYGQRFGDYLHARATAPGDLTYYVRVDCLEGAGAYELEYEISETEEDDSPWNFVVADTFPVIGQVSELGDWADYKMVWLNAGQLTAFKLSSTTPGAELALFVAPFFEDPMIESDRPGAVEDGVFMPSWSGYYLVGVSADSLGSTPIDYVLQLSTDLGSGPDDDLPGVVLPDQDPVLGDSGSTTGDLDFLMDNSDVFRVVLEEGQKFEAKLTVAGGDENTAFWMQTYDDGALTLADSPIGQSFDGPAGVQGLTISNDTAQKQYYYVRVTAAHGTGDYTLSWKVTPADDDFPGRDAAPTTIDALDELVDTQDFHSFQWVEKGKTVTAALTGAAGTNFDLLLLGDDELPVAASGGPGSTESLTYVAPEDQYLTLVVKAQSGAGAYTLKTEAKFITSAALTTSSASKLSYNKAVNIAGALKVGGAGIGGMPVDLMVSTNGTTWTKAAAGTTAGTGAFSFPQNITAKRYYKVVFAGDTDYRGCETAKISFVPYASLTAPSKPSSATHGRAFTSAGYLRPKHRAGSTTSVKIECWQYASGRWVKRKTVSAKLGSDGIRYSASVSVPYAGTWKLRAVHADGDHYTTYSSYSSTFRAR